MKGNSPFDKINKKSMQFVEILIKDDQTQHYRSTLRTRHIAWTHAPEMGMIAARYASVAQLDRVLPSEGRGRGFESRRMRQIRKPA